MTVSRWLVLLTQEEFEAAQARAGYGELWHDSIPEGKGSLEFGDVDLTAKEYPAINGLIVKLVTLPAAENLERLKELHKLCRAEVNWETVVAIATSDPNLRCYFWSA